MLYLHRRSVPVLHRDLVRGLASWECLALHALLCREGGRQTEQQAKQLGERAVLHQDLVRTVRLLPVITGLSSCGEAALCLELHS